MKRVTAAFVATLVTVALASSAQADPSEYAIEEASASVTSTFAGDHPDFTTVIRLTKDSKGKLHSTTSIISVELPPGLVGNPTAVHKCTAVQLLSTDSELGAPKQTGCPQASQIGVTEVELFDTSGNLFSFREPIFNMEPRYGHPARFGFHAQVVPVQIDAELRPDREYSVTAKVEGPSSLIPLLSAESTFWGVPADESHDGERITAYEAANNNGSPETPDGKRSAGLVPVPLMINPTRCGQAQGVSITAIPYGLPSLEAKALAPLTPNSGCGLLGFKPEMSVQPTSSQAETGSGLGVELSPLSLSGFENPVLPVEAALKKTRVTLPEGITINPSQAEGLGVCSKADFARETASSLPNEGCPETSKIGSAVGESPLIDKPVEGSLYVAKPYDNPFGSLIALYFVFKVPSRGVIVKLPAKVEPDPQTGRLVTTVDDIPQAAVGGSFELHFREGARAPLVTPPTCGTYRTTAELTSWAAPKEPVVSYPSFEITGGVNGGPCPSSSPPFRPGFSAGTINNNASSFSPSYLRLTRQDGDQDLTKFSTTFPPGLVPKLADVTRCSDAAIAAAKAKTGKEEQARPSCPLSSEIGNALGGAGVGSVLTYVRGKLYLAGPYNGAQLSVVAIVPAVAGPFDVGTVVTRQAISLDPNTYEGRVDGSRSDPLPHILAGIPLRVRDIRAYVDRPEFTLNPTGCDREEFKAQLWGGGLDVFSPADDSPVSRSSRFQAANCSLLGFKPRLSLKLSGGTNRGGHPALRAVLRPRKGDANLSSAQVTLPRSAFIEQSHFRTICTRVQFAANQCPPGSVYGRIRAFSPLLDEPLEGKVYLRSSSHQLPDLVFALRGLVDINVVGKVDSYKGRLRGTFDAIPDAPVSKAILTMQGGKKGLFVNSTNLCAGAQRASAKLDGQNGKAHDFSPVVGNSCGGKGEKK